MTAKAISCLFLRFLAVTARLRAPAAWGTFLALIYVFSPYFFRRLPCHSPHWQRLPHRLLGVLGRVKKARQKLPFHRFLLVLVLCQIMTIHRFLSLTTALCLICPVAPSTLLSTLSSVFCCLFLVRVKGEIT